MVGNQGFERNVFQRYVFLAAKRVPGGQHQGMLPFITGQGDQLGIPGQRLGGNANLGDFINQHACHLVWRALMQADVDLGVGDSQLGDRLWQDIAGLSVCGRHGQCATVFCAELLSNAFEITNLTHDQLNAFKHMLSGLRDAFQALAVPRKNLYTQFFFELDDGFGDARLRRMQRLGCLSQVEIAPGRFLDKSELVKIHDNSGISRNARSAGRRRSGLRYR